MLLALLIFIVAPIIEIVVIVKVAGVIGGWNTVGLLILTSIVGAYLVRHEGFAVLRKVQAQLNRGVLPGNELIDGLLVLAGGLMMLVPGFITDVVGLVLVLPPTRPLGRAVVLRWVDRRLSSQTRANLFGPRRVRVRYGPAQRTPPPSPPPPSAGPPAAIEGEIIDPPDGAG